MTPSGWIETAILGTLLASLGGAVAIGLLAVLRGTGAPPASDFLRESLPPVVDERSRTPEPTRGVAAEMAPSAPEPAPELPVPPKAPDWLGGLRRTRGSWVAGLSRLLGGKSRLDEAALEELEDLLFGADLGTRTADQLLEVARRSESPDRVRADIQAEALAILTAPRNTASGSEAAGTEVAGNAPSDTPHVVMVVGVNGAGKTTSIGKLAHRAVQAGEDVILAAGDTFRAAAIEQLEVWAGRSGAEFVRTRQGGDPASVAFDAVKAATTRGANRVFIDTAGRLQTDRGLMDELQKIARVVKKEIPDAPHEVLLVLDAHTGQNAIRQAQEFTKAVDVTGIVLTKLDGTAKGGVILGITQEVGIPVRYVGIGEGIEDLAEFDAAAFVEALFAAGSQPETFA